MFKSLLLLLLLATPAAWAGEAEIKQALQQNYPQLGEIRQVSPSPIPGLYEVVTPDHLFYTDDKVQYLFDGSIYELKSMRNLTDERERKVFAIDFNSLPLNLALKKVKGDGSRKLAIFTDPNCAFCKKLEHELQQVDNITIYRLLYPVFPGSDEKVRNVLCSKNPNQAWEDLLLRNVVPPTANCKTQTAKVLALGQKYRVSGTPTLIFADGSLVPGYMPAAALEKALDGASSGH
ncbi:MAG: thioredoxin fold domain-containing protein [Sideroxydans sp.]|nr:thioredoxin fold domain-containing protein [Sideroxydans sp.]